MVEEEWVDAVALYESTLRKYDMPASGLAIGDKATVEAVSRGKSFIVASSDMYSLMGQGLTALGNMRQNIPAMNYSEAYKTL